jgi:uncharacterized UPF0146 family protein
MKNIWSNFTEYIIKNYHNAQLIVEVGVGMVFDPSIILKEKLPNTNIKLVDIHPSNETVLKDDITKPNDTIYKDANLIYSIRPPEELQRDILNLGIKYNSDIIIKPLFTEEINYNLQRKLKLINYNRSAFYLYKRDKNELGN